MAITDKSKIKKFNGEKLPQELKDISHWVAWKAEPIKNKNGEVQYSKIPYNVESGYKASTVEPKTWSNYENALKTLEQSGVYEGLGFVLSQSDDIVFLDIDGCIEDNEFIDSEGSTLAQTLLGTTYCEYSPSGTGVHAYFKGELSNDVAKKVDSLGLELYNKERYMTVTGSIIEGSVTTICDDQNIIDKIADKYFHKENNEFGLNLEQGEGNEISIEKIIELCMKNTKYDEKYKMTKGEKFKTLFEGNWENIVNFDNDHSRADLSLINTLAFWTNRDMEKIDAIFRQSNLMRDKWDKKNGKGTYGTRTMKKGIERCKEGYTGKKKTYSYDDTGNAERFRDYSQGVMKYNYDSKKWMAYDGKRWVADEGMRSKQMVDEVIKEMTNEPLFEVEGIPVETLQKERYRHIKETRNHNKKVNMLKEAHHLLSIRNKDFDKDLYSFNVQNGYIDLKNNKLLPHDKAL